MLGHCEAYTTERTSRSALARSLSGLCVKSLSLSALSITRHATPETDRNRPTPETDRNRQKPTHRDNEEVKGIQETMIKPHTYTHRLSHRLSSTGVSYVLGHCEAYTGASRALPSSCVSAKQTRRVLLAKLRRARFHYFHYFHYFQSCLGMALASLSLFSILPGRPRICALTSVRSGGCFSVFLFVQPSSRASHVNDVPLRALLQVC